MIVIDPKSKAFTVAVLVVLIAPLALVSFGRHQGWQQHRECIAEAVARGDVSTAEAVAQTCQEMP